MTTYHFRNLTNGILCAPAGSRGNIRIGSTTCEQKQWAAVLRQAGVDILALLAQGATVYVHDQSERPRLTRAQWQGLSWIRYATARAWGLEPAVELSRNGSNVMPYWADQYERLDRSDLNYLRYFRAFANGRQKIRLLPCACPRQPWPVLTSQQIQQKLREIEP